MKKCGLTFLFCVLLFGCARSPLSVRGEVERDPIRPYRSLRQAEDFASDIVSRFNTKASSDGFSDIFCVKKAITKSDDKVEIDDTLMFVFNISSGGFVIVSADNQTSPLIAYVENGHINESLTTGVEPFDDYLAEVIANLSSKGPVRAPRELFRYETFFKDTGVDPLVSVKWGQEDIYGGYCPNSVAGCVATAVAQIMTKHESPESFTASVPMGNYSAGSAVSLTWSEMKQHVKGHYSTSDPCTSYHSEISALLREIGARVNMEYHVDSTIHSSAYSSDVPAMFNSFGYSCSGLMDYQENRIIRSLKNGNPVYMSGSRITSVNNIQAVDTTFAGHAFLIDGYIDCGEYFQTYIWNGTTYEFFTQTEISGRHVFHINWGWDGIGNGYFPFGVFDVGLGDQYDEYNPGLSGYDYFYHKKIIVDIHPTNSN